MSNREELSKNFENIRNYLDSMDEIREKLLPMQRKTVRWCSEIIKHVHREEWDPIPQKIEAAQAELLNMENLIKKAPGNFTKDYLQIVKQELGEAIILYNILVNDRFPTIEECKIDLVSYPFALADVVGELRRNVLLCLRNENLIKAQRSLELMDEIYSQLFTLDYPSGLIPGLRKKTDMARGILAKTEGDVSVTINILKLNANLEKSNKENN